MEPNLSAPAGVGITTEPVARLADPARAHERADDLIQLTENQKAAIASIVRWYRASNRPPVYRLAGYAGTGKTTVLRFVAQTRRRLALVGDG